MGRAAQLGEEMMQIASDSGLLVDPNSEGGIGAY